jgi:phosphate transport system permease protein
VAGADLIAGFGSSPSGGGPDLIRRRTTRSVGEQVIKGLLAAAALLSVLTTTGIVVSLASETIQFFGEVGIGDYLTGTDWSPLSGGDTQSFGVLPLVFSTFYLTAIGLVIAIPLGIASAIYLAEYASPRVRKTIKPTLELLAGIPTIVLGYFALTYVTPVILRDLLGLEVQIFNGLSAGIALSAVPQSLREGAYGMGATKRQVVTRVVFPAALSGIVAALVLGASRAVGETVVILVAGGASPHLGFDWAEPHQTMAAFIAQTARGDISTGSTEFLTIYAVGATLFVITLILNAIAIGFVRKFRQVYE